MCATGGCSPGPQLRAHSHHRRFLSHYCRSANSTDWLESSLYFVLIFAYKHSVCTTLWSDRLYFIPSVKEEEKAKKTFEDTHANISVWNWCFINAVVKCLTLCYDTGLSLYLNFISYYLRHLVLLYNFSLKIAQFGVIPTILCNCVVRKRRGITIKKWEEIGLFTSTVFSFIFKKMKRFKSYVYFFRSRLWRKYYAQTRKYPWLCGQHLQFL